MRAPVDPASPARRDPGSFRDPRSRVFRHDGNVYRTLSQRALEDWHALSSSDWWPKLVDEGKVVATSEIPLSGVELAEQPTAWAGCLRHEPLPLVSYPYEWSFSMLRDAAILQLELMAEAVGQGFVLRDATPYNVQWRGSQPIFVDIGSFARLEPGEPWLAYRQFCELFLFPLLVTAYRNIPFQPLLRGALDGIPADLCRRLLGARDLLRPGVLVDVVLQSRLTRATAASDLAVRNDLRSAGFSSQLIARNVDRLRRLLAGLRWKPERSAWSEYGSEHGYGDEDHDAKRRFVAEVAAQRRWAQAWDLGCNTGEYTRILAAHADLVVALDGDQLAIERLYAASRSDPALRQRVLPLVIDLADPSPGLGWRHRERPALEQRARPELVVCLALVHHLAITHHLPLPEIVDWLADLAPELVVEMVGTEDPMVRRLLRNQWETHEGYGHEPFASNLGRRFQIVRRLELAGGRRVLYHARRLPHHGDASRL